MVYFSLSQLLVGLTHLWKWFSWFLLKTSLISIFISKTRLISKTFMTLWKILWTPFWTWVWDFWFCPSFDSYPKPLQFFFKTLLFTFLGEAFDDPFEKWFCDLFENFSFHFVVTCVVFAFAFENAFVSSNKIYFELLVLKETSPNLIFQISFWNFETSLLNLSSHLLNTC